MKKGETNKEIAYSSLPNIIRENFKNENKRLVLENKNFQTALRIYEEVVKYSKLP
ncbi:hypothetical protein ACX8XN_04330 [Calditrichota bacterium GD2]